MTMYSPRVPDNRPHGTCMRKTHPCTAHHGCTGTCAPHVWHAAAQAPLTKPQMASAASWSSPRYVSQSRSPGGSTRDCSLRRSSSTAPRPRPRDAYRPAASRPRPARPSCETGATFCDGERLRASTLAAAKRRVVRTLRIAFILCRVPQPLRSARLRADCVRLGHTSHARTLEERDMHTEHARQPVSVTHFRDARTHDAAVRTASARCPLGFRRGNVPRPLE